MPLLRIGFAIMMILLGGLGIVLGATIAGFSLPGGSIAISVPDAGRMVTHTVLRAVEPGRYWGTLAMVAGAPALLGLLAAFLGWRMLSRA
jgi:hypothetical protein